MGHLFKFILSLVTVSVVFMFNNCGDAFRSYDPSTSGEFSSIKPVQCRKVPDSFTLQSAEESTILEGRLQIIIVDHKSGEHQRHYTLIVDSGEIWNLELEELNSLDGLHSQSTVRLLGNVIDHSNKIFLVKSTPSNRKSFELMSTKKNLFVSGSKKYLAVRVEFSDGAACSSSSVSSNLNTLSSYYRAASDNQFDFSLSKSDTVTVKINYPKLTSGACYSNSRGSWRTAVTDALSAKGINVNNYDYSFYFYNLDGCGAVEGWAEISGKHSAIFNCTWETVLSHEAGHLLGLGHSGIGNSAYADGSCVMGNKGIFRLNGPHKNMMGWVASGKMISVIKPSTVKLAPLSSKASSSSLPQLAEIKIAGMSRSLYASYRKSGFTYGNLGAQYQNKLNIHSIVASTPNKTDFKVAYGAGSTARPPGFPAGTKLLVKEITRDHIEFEVYTDQNGPCKSLNGGVSITKIIDESSSENQTNKEFERSYSIDIENLDVQSCLSSNFEIDITHLTLFSILLSTSKVTNLTPGNSSSIQLDVRIDQRIGSGSYPLILKIIKEDGLVVEKTIEIVVVNDKGNQANKTCPEGYEKY